MKNVEKEVVPTDSRSGKYYAIVTNEAIEKQINDYCNKNNLDNQMKQKIKIFVSKVLSGQYQEKDGKGVKIPASFWSALFGKGYKKIKDHAIKSGVVESKSETDKGKPSVTSYSIAKVFPASIKLEWMETSFPFNDRYMSHLESESAFVKIRNFEHFDGAIDAHNGFINEIRQSVDHNALIAELEKLSKNPEINSEELSNNLIEVAKLMNGEGFVADITSDGGLKSSFSQLNGAIKNVLTANRPKLRIAIKLPNMVNWLLYNNLVPGRNDSNPYHDHKHLFRVISRIGKPYPNEFLSENLRECSLEVNVPLQLLYERTRNKDRNSKDDIFSKNGIDLVKLNWELNSIHNDLFTDADEFCRKITYKLFEMNFDWESLKNYLNLNNLFRELDPDSDYELGGIWEGVKFELLEVAFDDYISSDPYNEFEILPIAAFRNVYPNMVKFIELIKKIAGNDFFIKMYRISMNVLINNLIERAKEEYDWNIINVDNTVLIPKHADSEKLQVIYTEEVNNLFYWGLTPWPLIEVE